MIYTKRIEKDIDNIINNVIFYYNISRGELLGAARKQNIKNTRFVTVFLLRKLLNLSYPKIGHTIGGRDHTTALHAFNVINKKLDYDSQLSKEIDKITENIVLNKIPEKIEIIKKDEDKDEEAVSGGIKINFTDYYENEKIKQHEKRLGMLEKKLI